MATLSTVDFAQGPSRIDKKRCGLSASLLYVSSYSAPSRIEIYPENERNPRPCGFLGYDAGVENPTGLFVDAAQNLWLVNSGPSLNILQFAKDATDPSLVLTGSSGLPRAVAVDPNDGTVYVTNSAPYYNSYAGVDVYLAGHSLPSYELTDQFSAYCPPQSVAVDKRGDVYVTTNGYGFTCGGVYEYKKGSQRGKELLSPSLKAFFSNDPLSIQTTASGALAICNKGATYTACGLVGPRSGDLIVAVFELVTTGSMQMVLTPGESAAFVTGIPVTKWAWPGSEHTPLETITNGYSPNNFGIAVSPADPPGAPF